MVNTDCKVNPYPRQTLVNNLTKAISTYLLPFGSPNSKSFRVSIQQVNTEGADLILTEHGIENQVCTEEPSWTPLPKVNLLYRGLILGFFLGELTHDTSMP